MNEKVIQHDKYDVIVVGGGIAGIAAAVSAARQNMKVLLIEKLVNLGGLATEGLISYYEPLCDGNGKQLIYGIADELIKLSVKYSFDTIPEVWKNGSEETRVGSHDRYYTYYSPTVFSMALEEYVLNHGVKVLFDTLATYPVMDGKRCVGIKTETVKGCEIYPCNVVIDATGNATVMHRAGVPTVEGENFMSYVSHGYDVDGILNEITPFDMRKWDWISGGEDLENNHKLKGVTAENITDYVVYGKKKLFEKIKKKRREGFDIMTLPGMAQLRKIRRIVGETDFCADVEQHFDDSIGICGDWRPSAEAGKVYQMPMGAMYNADFENLIAAGRIISSPDGNGWEVARVIPVCAMTGEAAGKMASLCVKHSCVVHNIAKKYFEEFKNL